MNQPNQYKVTWKSGDIETLTLRDLQEAHKGFAGSAFFCKDLKRAIREIETDTNCQSITLKNGIKIERT